MTKLISELVGHAVMGAYVGLFCATAILCMDGGGIREFLSTASSPTLALAEFMVGVSVIFAVGMTITGFALTHDQHHPH